MKIYKRNIFGYLKSVFIESWQLAFTFFDLIGIILFLYPNLADKLVKDDVITRLIGGGIFIASMGLIYASVLSYNTSAQVALGAIPLGIL